MRLQPHLCDMEYHHAQNLGWVRLKAANESRWMRMAPRFSQIVLPTTRAPVPTPNQKCRENTQGEFSCAASSKMRFMGLTSTNMQYYHDSQTQEVVTDGKSCGLCTTERFTYAGKRMPRINPHTKKVKLYADTLLCGSFGDKYDGDDAECVLDKHTGVFAYVYKFYSNGQSTCRNLIRQESMGRFQTKGGDLVYNRQDKENVRTVMEEIFTFDEKIWITAPDQLNERQRRHDFLQCVDDIIAYKKLIKHEYIDMLRNFSTLVEGKEPYRQGENFARHLELTAYVSGMYHFTVFNTYEVPMLYWQKLGLETYVHIRPQSRRLPAYALAQWKENFAQEPAFQQFAWEARYGHETASLDFNVSSALYHRLTSTEDVLQDHALSVKAAWSALTTKQLVPEQQEFFRYFGRAIARFIAEHDKDSPSLYVSKYEFGTPKTLQLAETAHMAEATMRADFMATTHAAATEQYREAFSGTIYDMARQSQPVKLQRMKQVSGSSGLYTLESQYHHRAVAARSVVATAWIYHGTSPPRGVGVTEVDSTQTASICNMLSSDTETRIVVSTPRRVNVNEWVNCAGRFFVPWGGADTQERAPFAVYADSEIDVEAHKHQFIGDVIQDVFFGRASEGADTMKVKYFDPSAEPGADTRYTWEAGNTDGANMVLEQELNNNRLPLAILKLDTTTAPALSLERKRDVIDHVLREHSNRAENACHENTDEDGLSLQQLAGAASSASSRCIYNPLQRKYRRLEQARDTTGLRGKTSDITITAGGGANFTWNLCMLRADHEDDNGYATPQRSADPIADGTSCSFSNLVLASSFKLNTVSPVQEVRSGRILCDSSTVSNTSVISSSVPLSYLILVVLCVPRSSALIGVLRSPARSIVNNLVLFLL